MRKCSVEGRSAMTTDSLALHDALNTIHLCRPPRGKHYVDSFLRAAMIPGSGGSGSAVSSLTGSSNSASGEEELMAWVRENWQSYAYRHIHGLLTQTLFSLLNSKKLKDATAVIDSLYELKDGGGSSSGGDISSTLSGLLAQAQSAGDGTFSRAFSSTFRRQSINMSGMMS